LEINVHEDSRVVDVWLTGEERDNQELRERMKPLYRNFSERHYTVAVFLSGGQDLAGETSALLCYNRRRLAELEVQREKEQAALGDKPEEIRGTVMTM